MFVSLMLLTYLITPPHQEAHIQYVHTYIRTYIFMNYVHMYAIYVCMYIRTQVCTYVRTYISTYVLYLYIRTCIIPVHMYIRTYIHMYIRKYIRIIPVHTYIYLYYTGTYVHTYIRTYVRTYVSTYVHAVWYTHACDSGSDRCMVDCTQN